MDIFSFRPSSLWECLPVARKFATNGYFALSCGQHIPFTVPQVTSSSRPYSHCRPNPPVCQKGRVKFVSKDSVLLIISHRIHQCCAAAIFRAAPEPTFGWSESSFLKRLHLSWKQKRKAIFLYSIKHGFSLNYVDNYNPKKIYINNNLKFIIFRAHNGKTALFSGAGVGSGTSYFRSYETLDGINAYTHSWTPRTENLAAEKCLLLFANLNIAQVNAETQKSKLNLMSVKKICCQSAKSVKITKSANLLLKSAKSLWIKSAALTVWHGRCETGYVRQEIGVIGDGGQETEVTGEGKPYKGDGRK